MKKIILIISLILTAILLLVVGFTVYKNQNMLPKSVLSQKTFDWQGKWVRENSNTISSSELLIDPVKNSSFAFSIYAIEGGNIGQISADSNPVATIANNTAVAKVVDGSGSVCMLKLVIEGSNSVSLTADNCQEYVGNGVSFNGNYVKNGKVEVFSLGDIVLSSGGDTGKPIFKNENEIASFKNLVGDYYAGIFATSIAPAFDDQKDLDGFGARVYYGWMVHNAGQAAIIMLAPSGKIWAAVTDYDEQSSQPLVQYFTNDANYKNQLPKTISHWLQQQENDYTHHKIIFNYKP